MVLYDKNHERAQFTYIYRLSGTIKFKNHLNSYFSFSLFIWGVYGLCRIFFFVRQNHHEKKLQSESLNSLAQQFKLCLILVKNGSFLLIFIKSQQRNTLKKGQPSQESLIKEI